MTIRLEVLAGKQRTPFLFDQPEVWIGSTDDNHVILPHSSVRARHCTIREEAGTGFRIEQSGVSEAVSDGEMIAVGDYRVVLHDRALPSDLEQRFLDDVVAQPDDEMVREVYADWLEEQGRHDEASFLHLQAANDRRYIELSAKLPLSWRRLVVRAPIENCIQFEFECPQRWEALDLTDSPDKRYCDACEKHVHYAPTVSKARRLAIAGHCVAVDIGQGRKANDLKELPAMRMGSVVTIPRDRR